MSVLRRVLGILVMIAGVLGLVLSLAGLIGVWLAKPAVGSSMEATIATLDDSIGTSKRVMETTEEALSATVESVDALATLLASSAESVSDTMPVLSQLDTLLGEQLPATLTSATGSLRTAQQSAEVVDSAIVSLDTFRFLMGGVPLLRGLIAVPEEPYHPENSLADSLGELAGELEGLPSTFTEMAGNLDTADDNLATVESSLNSMADSVGMISDSLSSYKTMVGESQTSLDNLRSVLTDLEGNLSTIIDGAAIVLTLILLWLLAAQLVILSQGWELYQGTADRIAGARVKPED